MDEIDNVAAPLNLCTSCGQDFGGERAFDLHRVGDHDHLFSPDHPEGRRCLTEQEMIERGMYRGRYGRWSQPLSGLPAQLGSTVQARSMASQSI